MAKPKLAPTGHTGPAYNVSSIYSARRDLRPVSKALVQNSGLGVEAADLLVLLYGFRKLGWKDCPVYDEGFVNFTDLKTTTVYDPGLFTRRIGTLVKAKMVEVRSGREAKQKLHGKAKQVRIENAGITAIKPIWDRYVQFCEELLKEFSADDLKVHQAINERISQILRDRRDPAKQVLGLAA
jgi:DNA-binding MarR family transcriptional regulator